MAIPTKSATKAAARYVSQGLIDPSHIYGETRDYYIDNDIVLVQRAAAPLFVLLWNKISRMKSNDYQPKWFKEVYDEGVFTPNSSQSASTCFTLDFGTTGIRSVIPGMQFTVNGIYFKAHSTLATGDWVYNRGMTNSNSDVVLMEEIIEVTSVDLTNGTATIKRGDGTRTGTCNKPITTSMRLVRKETPLAMGQDEPNSYKEEPHNDTNNVETFSKTAKMARQLLNSTDLIGSGEERWSKFVSEKEYQLLVEIERALRKGSKTTSYVGDAMKLTMGGIIEFIQDYSKNAALDNISRGINLAGNPLQLRGAYSDGGAMDLCALIFQYGNPMKFAFCGQQIINEWTTMWSNHFRVNDELSGKILLNVTSVETNAGLLNFLKDPNQDVGNLDSGTASQNTSMDMLVADINDLDLIVKQEPKRGEVVSNNHSRIVEIFADVGLMRKGDASHAYIYNIGRNA